MKRGRIGKKEGGAHGDDPYTVLPGLMQSLQPSSQLQARSLLASSVLRGGGLLPPARGAEGAGAPGAALAAPPRAQSKQLF